MSFHGTFRPAIDLVDASPALLTGAGLTRAGHCPLPRGVLALLCASAHKNCLPRLLPFSPPVLHLVHSFASALATDRYNPSSPFFIGPAFG
jgi:hypothetical protein